MYKRQSHDGACGRDDLEFAWEKISGPEGATFAGQVNLPVASVVFTNAGEYTYSLTVSTAGEPDSARSRRFSVSVSGGADSAFLLCDSNADGKNTLADAIFTLRNLFLGDSQTRCDAAMDCDSDGEITLSDSVFNLNYLFLAGNAPNAPFPDCDTTPAENCEISNCQN